MEVTYFMMRKLVEGLMFLHEENKLAHLDIKPDNIVIKDDFSPAYIDFGYARNVNVDVKEQVGTEKYMPPEV